MIRYSMAPLAAWPASGQPERAQSSTGDRSVGSEWTFSMPDCSRAGRVACRYCSGRDGGRWLRARLQRPDASGRAARHNTAVDEDSVVELFEQLGWHGRPGLTDVDIAQLEADLGVTFPPDVRAFLRWSDGGDDWLGEAYVSIHSAEDLRACNGDEFREFFPGLVHIGGNGGLEGFCLDYRADRILSPMVSVDLTN